MFYTRAIRSVLSKATIVRPPLAYGRNPILGGGGRIIAMPQQHLQAYGSVGWLFSIVSRLSESVASARWRLIDEGTDEEVEQHPVINLWKRPNPYMSRYEFIEIFQQHLDLVGESYWLLVGNSRNEIKELWPLRPDRVQPIPHPTEFIAGYVYRIGTVVLNLRPEDLIWLRRPNPLDSYRGLGPVQAILADLDAERFSAQWNRAFFLNSAEPGGIIESPEELSDADYERFILRWREGHQGVANAHRIAMLEAGMKWHERKYTMRDMQFQQLRMVNRDVILGAFGVPKSFIGQTDDVQRGNFEASMVMVAQQAIVPRLERIGLALNERLLPRMGADTLEWEFDDPSPVNRELGLEEATKGYAGHVLTLNEARRRMGESPVKDGDAFAPWPLAQPPPGLPAEHNMRVGLSPGLVFDMKALSASDIDRLRVSMERSWTTRLHTEVSKLIEHLVQAEPKNARRKIGLEDVETFDWDWWLRYGDEVVAELLGAFSAVFVAEAPDLSPTLAQRLAEQYATERGGLLLKLDGDLNLQQLTRNRVRELVAETIRDGESLRTLQKRLREDYAFSPQRAETVARTESATALGRGTLEAGFAQGKDEKAWFTQGDSRVTPECRENAAAGWIAIRDSFPSGMDTVPQHPRCRCSIATRIRLATDSVRLLAVVRCPECRRVQGHDVTDGRFTCPRCKTAMVVVAGVLTKDG